jgi:DNA-binding CsgD family transcriptional regulator/tetratricopeptide (TPR) repeat protein
MQQAVSGSGSMAIVGGEAGAGKTALIDQFIAQSAGSTRVLVGACDALSTPRPLGPLLDVGSLLGNPVEHLLRATEHRSELFTTLLDTLSAGPPTLFIIEDVHWADEATLDLLRFLGRRIDRAPVLLVVTFRDDEVTSRHPLQTVLGDLATTRTIQRIKVSPLTEAAVSVLSADTSFDPVELYRTTGGNPFFVTEVLAAKTTRIPSTVRDTVLTRVARLSLAGRKTLDAAAVIGERVHPWLLASIVDDAAEAVDECLTTGLLQSGDGMLLFRHQLAQQVVMDAISAVRRAELHKRVLRALRTRPYPQKDFATLAHHADAAGNTSAVLEFAPKAAEQASALGAHRESAAQYVRALRFGGNMPTDKQVSLLSGWLFESFATGNMSDSINACEQLLKLARSTEDRAREAFWLSWLSQALVNNGRNAEAEEASDAALDLLEDIPAEEIHAFAYKVQARMRMHNRDLGEAILWGERAIDLAHRHDNPAVLVGAISAVGLARLLGGAEQRGREELEQGLAVAREARLDAEIATLLTNLGSVHGEIYRFDLADHYLSQALAFSAEHDLDGIGVYARAWLSIAHMFRGRWNEAADLAHSVVDLPHAMMVARIMALVTLSRVLVRRGDPDSTKVLDDALALAELPGILQRLAPARAARAEAAWLAGDREQVIVEASAVYDLAVEHGHQWHIGELGYWRWKAGDLGEPSPDAAEPYVLQMNGEWAAAATAWTSRGCPYESARALAESDNEDAMRDAFATFDLLGAKPAAQMVAQRLRALGFRAIPRGARPTTRAHPAMLTTRESEVLELVAHGCTNPEIAASLFISPKTVEHHVSSLLGKLGASSRQEAVRVAAELDLLTPN